MPPTKTSELDDVIRTMIETPRPVIADICVDQKENCFPMIPGGKAHNEILLGPSETLGEATPEEGMVLV